MSTNHLTRRGFCTICRRVAYDSAFITSASTAVGFAQARPAEPIGTGGSHHDKAIPRDAPWATLPPTPPLPETMEQWDAPINGVRIFYAASGLGEPVIFLHGGLANSNYWGHQLVTLSTQFRVVAMDTRGHGRSTMSAEPLSYELMARDVIGVMDLQGIKRASIVGWSDGAIIGLELAIRHPERIVKLFSFGANYNLKGVQQAGASSRTFEAYKNRCHKEYEELAQCPREYSNLLRALYTMWRSQPNYTVEQLRTIRCPVTIADGQYDEIILLRHTKELSEAIPASKLVIEPRVSHFAMIQDPTQFTKDILTFLKSR